jgi:hypothetical protein
LKSGELFIIRCRQMERQHPGDRAVLLIFARVGERKCNRRCHGGRNQRRYANGQKYCVSCEVLERYEHSRDHRRTVRLPLRRKRRPFTQDVCGCHRGLDSEWVGHASNVNFLTPSEKGRRPTFCRPAKAGVKRQATRQAVSGRYRAGLNRRTIPKRTVHHLLGSEPPERYV